MEIFKNWLEALNPHIDHFLDDTTNFRYKQMVNQLQHQVADIIKPVDDLFAEFVSKFDEPIRPHPTANTVRVNLRHSVDLLHQVVRSISMGKFNGVMPWIYHIQDEWGPTNRIIRDALEKRIPKDMQLHKYVAHYGPAIQQAIKKAGTQITSVIKTFKQHVVNNPSVVPDEFRVWNSSGLIDDKRS